MKPIIKVILQSDSLSKDVQGGVAFGSGAVSLQLYPGHIVINLDVLSGVLTVLLTESLAVLRSCQQG